MMSLKWCSQLFFGNDFSWVCRKLWLFIPYRWLFAFPVLLPYLLVVFLCSRPIFCISRFFTLTAPRIFVLSTFSFSVAPGLSLALLIAFFHLDAIFLLRHIYPLFSYGLASFFAFLVFFMSFKGTGLRDIIPIFGQKCTVLAIKTSPGFCFFKMFLWLDLICDFWRCLGENVLGGITYTCIRYISTEFLCGPRCSLLVHCLNFWFLLVHCLCSNIFFRIA